MSEERTHISDCDWHVDQYPWECTCGFIPRKKAMDNLIAQDADLIDKLRDEDSYYRLQEKHWCIDAEELERQRLAAADRIEELASMEECLTAELGDANDRIEALEAENERLEALFTNATYEARAMMEEIERLRAELSGWREMAGKAEQ